MDASLFMYVCVCPCNVNDLSFPYFTVAVIGLEQMNYVVASPEEEQVTVQVVEVCVVTNNTLERTFVLSLITGPTNSEYGWI